MIKFDGNFWANIRFNMTAEIQIAAYTQISQFYSEEENCWVQREPSYIWLGIYDICDFHDTTEEELHKNVCFNVKFPTEFCTMTFHDKNNIAFNSINKIGRIFVVGSAKENNKKLSLLLKHYDNVRDLYYEEISELQDKYENMMNAGE